MRIGLNVGRTTARGVKIEGAEDAIRREMNEVVGVMISEKGEGMRKRAREVREIVLNDMMEGPSSDNMMSLGDVGRSWPFERDSPLQSGRAVML